MSKRLIFSPPSEPVPVPKTDSVMVLAQHETLFRLRFGRKVKNVRGTGTFSFFVEKDSDVFRFLEKGFPPVSEETKPQYHQLFVHYDQQLGAKETGFNGMLVDDRMEMRCYEILRLFTMLLMFNELEEPDQDKLDAHMKDYKITGIRFSWKYGPHDVRHDSPVLPPSWLPSFAKNEEEEQAARLRNWEYAEAAGRKLHQIYRQSKTEEERRPLLAGWVVDFKEHLPEETKLWIGRAYGRFLVCLTHDIGDEQKALDICEQLQEEIIEAAVEIETRHMTN